MTHSHPFPVNDSLHSNSPLLTVQLHHRYGGGEGGREGGKEGGREGGREGKKGGREGGKVGGREREGDRGVRAGPVGPDLSEPLFGSFCVAHAGISGHQ